MFQKTNSHFIHKLYVLHVLMLYIKIWSLREVTNQFENRIRSVKMKLSNSLLEQQEVPLNDRRFDWFFSVGICLLYIYIV